MTTPRRALRATVEAHGWRVATGPVARLLGWVARREPPGRSEGLCLLPCRAVHTCFMRFPIDVVFLARDGTVLRRVERLAPWRAACEPRAYATLELPAGAAAIAGLTAGTRLSPPDRAQRSPHPTPPTGESSRPWSRP